MRNRSIRFRLTVWYTLALTLGLVLFALAIWLSMQRSLAAEIDRDLVTRAEGFRVFALREIAEGAASLHEELAEYAGSLPPGVAVRIGFSNAEVLLDTRPGFPFPNAGGPVLVAWQVNRYRAIVMRRGQLEIALAQPMDAVESLLTRLRWLLVFCIPPVILAAAIGGNWLSRRALQPVDEITRAARSFGIGNLSDRLPVPQTGDELQRLAETWNGMLTRLEAAVKRLTRFTADASHELRTPLAVIRTTAEIAARRARSPEGYREALGNIVAEAQRMTNLVEDLLFLARCDSEAAEMPMTTVDLAAVVEEACCHARPLGEARNIAIESRGRDVAILGNGLAIRQLLIVLLDNAIKYSPAGASVQVAVAGPVVEIADHGIGIPESDMPHIFERFYRARQNGAESTPGYGLGLSLADAIAKRHGARIEVASAPGAGSIFRVIFELT